MKRIEENAKIVILLIEDLINKESNQVIKMSLNELKNYHITILNIKINEWNCNKALNIMEKIKEWRTVKLNNYLINTEEGKKILESIMKLKLSLTKYVYCC